MFKRIGVGIIQNRLICLTLIFILLGLITEISSANPSVSPIVGGGWGMYPYRLVSVNSIPEGADIIFDGIYVGKTPSDIRTNDIKTHYIRLDLEGYNSWEGTISSSQWNSDINVRLDKK